MNQAGHRSLALSSWYLTRSFVEGRERPGWIISAMYYYMAEL